MGLFRKTERISLPYDLNDITDNSFLWPKPGDTDADGRVYVAHPAWSADDPDGRKVAWESNRETRRKQQQEQDRLKRHVTRPEDL